MVEETYQRIDLAKEQLEIAIELFLASRSYVSSLTLAGAAEEILGQGLLLRREKTTLQWEFPIVEPVENLFRKHQYTWSEFIVSKNRARNAAKHMNKESGVTITADLMSEAIRMIVRALDNHARLGLTPTLPMQEFDNWFNENFVGPQQ
jgi:hypothetical protein